MNRRVIAGLLLAMALPALDLMALGAAGPAIAGDLGRLDQIAWLFVSYQLALVVSVPVYGKTGDLWGRRVVFLSAVTVFTLSSLLAGLAWSFPALVVARVGQGIGGGGILSQTQAVIGDLVPARDRGRYAWLTPTVWTIASFLGPVFGGAVAELVGWRWIFLVNLPVGLVSMVFVRDAFPSRSAEPGRRLDVPGAVMLVVSYGALVLAVSIGGETVPWDSPVVIGAFVVGGVVLLALLRYETRAVDPVLPLHLLRLRVVRSCTATTFLIGSVNFMAVAFLPLMLQVVNGAGATEAGLAILPTTFGIAVASTIVGRIVTRTGYYRIWPAVGSAVFGIGFLLLGSLGPHPSTAVVWTGTLLLGLGMGAGSPVFMLAMQNAVPQRDLGVVSAMAMFFRNTGQAFGTAIAGAVFAVRLDHHLDRLVSPSALDGLGADELAGDVDAVRALAPDVEALVSDAFRLAATDVFTLAGWVGVASVAVALTIPQMELRRTVE